MNWRTYISVDPRILVGKPILTGTRLAVEFVLGLMAEGWSDEEILQNYPGLSREHLRACAAYARDRLKDERVFVLAAG